MVTSKVDLSIMDDFNQKLGSVLGSHLKAFRASSIQVALTLVSVLLQMSLSPTFPPLTLSYWCLNNNYQGN